MNRELNGRHVLLIALGAFGIIIGANMAMLFAATGSFPGLVVKNSYVAGVGWNDRAEAQQNLSWTSAVRYQEGVLTVQITDAAGAAVRDLEFETTVGRPSADKHDQVVVLRDTRHGYSGDVDLQPGIWQVRITTTGDPAFRQTASFIVREQG